MSEEERTYYKRDIIRICEGRGFTQKMIAQFLETWNSMASGYTEGMVDAFEFSVNGPAMYSLHSDMFHEV